MPDSIIINKNTEILVLDKRRFGPTRCSNSNFVDLFKIKVTKDLVLGEIIHHELVCKMGIPMDISANISTNWDEYGVTILNDFEVRFETMFISHYPKNREIIKMLKLEKDDTIICIKNISRFHSLHEEIDYICKSSKTQDIFYGFKEILLYLINGFNRFMFNR